MPLKLRAEIRASVKSALTAALPTIHVGSYLSVSLPFMAVDQALPKSGPVREKLSEYLDDYPLTDFVNDVVSDELERRDEFTFSQRRSLTDVEGYEDPAAVAEALIQQFESLPWSYTLTLLLPEQLNPLLPASESALQIGPNLRLRRVTDDFKNTFSLMTDNPTKRSRLKRPSGPAGLFGLRLPEANEATWKEDRVYLQVQTDGFIGRHPHSPTVGGAERLVRSFFGLGLATGMVYSRSYLVGDEDSISVYVHRASPSGGWEPFTRYDLSSTVARGILSLDIGDPDEVLHPVVDTDWILPRLNRIRAALQLGERGDPAMLAAQWLFDGTTGQDSLLTFVQLMVVLEILLGDKSVSDDIGISTLISNRFAYLVGTTHQERAEHISNFKKIYAVRSQIVHSGKPRLRPEEYRLLNQLRWMGRSVITKEIDMLLSPPRK